MSLGDSVEWRVIQSVVQALETVTDGNDTFYTSPARVFRMFGNVLEVVEYPCFIVTPLDSPHSHDCPNGLERVDLKLSVTCALNRAPELTQDNEALEKSIRDMATDAQKALLADLKRGGIAIDTIVQRVEVFELVGGQPVQAAEIVVTIPFRHYTADPTKAA